MTDSSELESDYSGECDRCLQDFDLFSLEMVKVYVDKDLLPMAVITSM